MFTTSIDFIKVPFTRADDSLTISLPENIDLDCLNYNVMLTLTISKSLHLPGTKIKLWDSSANVQRRFLTNSIMDFIHKLSIRSNVSIPQFIGCFEVQPNTLQLHTHVLLGILDIEHSHALLKDAKDIIKTMGFHPACNKFEYISNPIDALQYIKKKDTKYPSYLIKSI